ncbi:MAG: UpxY family transcription antiterminator [Armatimonadota bacterium]
MSSHQAAWYAVYTRSRHEKQVATFLARQGLEVYLPLRRTWSSRKDRKLTIEVPALPGYLFVKCVLYAETRALLKRSAGVIHLVDSVGKPAVIPEAQVESLRTALAAAVNAEGHPYLKAGERVRVIRGPLIGAEGQLLRVAESRHRLVLSIDYVNQAVSVEIDAADVDRVEQERRVLAHAA